MLTLRFTAPPLPHFIASGFVQNGPGFHHPNRRHLGVFDMLVVQDGVLAMKEDGISYRLEAGHTLILRPDAHHYQEEGSMSQTSHFWIHFHTLGSWSEETDTDPAAVHSPFIKDTLSATPFPLALPKFTRLLHPQTVYATIRSLNTLEQDAHRSWARWKQQLLFQNLLEQLSASRPQASDRPAEQVAEETATFLRMHYREEITAKAIGEALNFHPVYIARCMHRTFGCSPFEYLQSYRIEQAKLLLLQTNLPVSRISEEVGFSQPSYFTSSFSRSQGMSPRTFRKQFYHK